MTNFRWHRLSSIIAVAVAVFFSSLIVGTGFAQTGVISGSVVESGTDKSLPGTNVILVGTSMGAATDLEGNFRIIRVPPGAYQLEARFMGYKSQTKDVQVVVNQEATVNFELEIDPFLLEAVVVTGVASKTSKAVAEIAVQRISAADLVVKSEYTSVSDMLTGKIAGVSMTKASGDFGGPIRMNMRSGGGLMGDGQPVFYVDGVKVRNQNIQLHGNFGISPLASLNPEDIESIEVIKGAAGAGSYGTGGSNGVVLITTKRGRSVVSGARNWSVNYKGTFGWNDQDRQYGQKEFRNYEFMNDYFRRGPINKNSLSVTGGSESVRLYLGVDVSKEEGHTPRNAMDQKNLRANFDYIPSNKFSLKVSTAYNNTDIETPQSGRIWDEETKESGGEYAYLYFNRWPDAHVGWWRSDDFWDLQEETNKMNSFVGSVTAELLPFIDGLKYLKGLSGRITVGVDDKDVRNMWLSRPSIAEQHGVSLPGNKKLSALASRIYTLNSDIRYEYDLFGVKASAVVGMQAFEERSYEMGMEKEEFVSPLITAAGAAALFKDIREIDDHFKSAGIFTEHSFSYNNTYFGSFMIRKDYASVMGAEAPSTIYPRASVAVRLDRMGFLPSLFSLAKLRTAYGETGILPQRTDAIDKLWGATQGVYRVGTSIESVGNPGLKPERIKEWEIGFETEFSYFAVDFSYYKQWAFDSIVRKSNVPSSGLRPAPKYNVGEIQGQGWEAQVQAFFSGKQLGGWNANFSLTSSWQENEVISMQDEIIAAGAGGGRQVYMEGLPKSAFYNPITTGAIFSTSPDDIINERYNPRYGEPCGAVGAIIGVKHSEGPLYLGSGIPDYVGSFSTTFNLAGFTLYGMLQWKTGFVLYNEGYIDQLYEGIDEGGWYHGDPNAPEGWVDWNEGAGTNVYSFDYLSQQIGYGDCNTDAEVLTPGTQEYIDAANKWAQTTPYRDANGMQPGDFIRLRELSLSYDASKLIGLIGLQNYFQNFSVGVVGTNLWKKFKDDFTDVDSETNSLGYQANPQNMMQTGTIPLPKTISFFVRFGL